jgi:hypothetical protein
MNPNTDREPTATCSCPTPEDRGVRPQDLCDYCRKLLEVQEPFEMRLLEIAALEEKDPAAAIAILDEIYETYRDRDCHGWLDRNTRAHRAHIYTLNCKYAESLSELQALAGRLASLTEMHPHEFVENQRHMAFVLASLRRNREAIRELDAALVIAQKNDMRSVLPLLADCAEIALQEGLDVSSVHKEILVDSLRSWGIDAPTGAFESSLASAILQADEQRRAAQSRYESLLRQASRSSTEECATLTNGYVSSESVGFFRDMARALLRRSCGE